jgi:hypothetical protein
LALNWANAADIALLPFIARLGPALKAFRGYHLCDVQHTGCNSVLPRICAAMHAMQARRVFPGKSSVTNISRGN